MHTSHSSPLSLKVLSSTKVTIYQVVVYFDLDIVNPLILDPAMFPMHLFRWSRYQSLVQWSRWTKMAWSQQCRWILITRQVLATHRRAGGPNQLGACPHASANSPHSVVGLGTIQVLATRLREPVANGALLVSSLPTRSDQYETRKYDFACRDKSSGGLVDPSHVPQL